MASDEWKQFLVENFSNDSAVALNLEELTLQQVHGFLGIAERRLLAYVKDRKNEGCMPSIVMWKIDEIRKQLKYQRNALGAVLGYETWLNSVIESARRGDNKEEIIARLIAEKNLR